MKFVLRLALPLLLTLSLHAIPRLALPLSGTYPEKLATVELKTHLLLRSEEQTGSTDTHLNSLSTPNLIVARDIPTLPIGNDSTLWALDFSFHTPLYMLIVFRITPPLPISAEAQIDLRPQRQRLDYQAVRNILAVTRDWLLENIEDNGRQTSIAHGGFVRSLAEGVQISMVQAPTKRLTYGLALDAVERLIIWEMFIGRGKAVDFGVLENGVLKGAGGIKKSLNGIEAAR